MCSRHPASCRPQRSLKSVVTLTSKTQCVVYTCDLQSGSESTPLRWAESVRMCVHTHKCTYIYVHRYAYVCISECCCLVTKFCLTFCGPTDVSTPCIPVLHYLWSLLELMSIESVMLSNPLIVCCPSSPSTFNLSQHQGLFQWTSSLHEVAQVLELQLQLQHQSFQWIFRDDFL